MAEQADDLSEQEKQTRNEMLFALSERDRGTLSMVVTVNEWKRKELYQFLKDHLKEYIFFDLDLTSHTYTSLYRGLQELLPADILNSEPVRYLVNVTGLESSLYTTEDGKIEFSSLVSQLNFEREMIFNQPYIILLWISKGFDRELQKKAPDLMHWMSKRFVFDEGGDAGGFEVAEAEISYGPVRKPGKIPERLERIRQLEETWEKLKLHDEDQARLVKDKISLLLLLGKEYGAAFEFHKAESAFEKAIALNNKIKAGKEGDLFYSFGDFYYDFKKFDLSLKYFQKAFEAAEKDGSIPLGSIYHMLGMVYEEKGEWDRAMENYQHALEWLIETKNEASLNITYHQIGRLYECQGKWEDALKNYKQALEWSEKFNDEIHMGNTYHQIGMVFDMQKKWDEALKNYEQAIKWKEKSGSEYALGSTYHQLGIGYEKAEKWDKALENYEKAIEWFTKTGNEYQIGDSYYGIGHAFEMQNKLDLALDWYRKALDNNLTYEHPRADIDREAVESIEKRIMQQQTPNPQTPSI